MFKADSNDASVNSDDSTNTEGEELEDHETTNCTIKTSNLLHSILTEGTQGSFSGSVYQPTLKGFERMTVTDKNDEQKSITNTRYNVTVPVLTISQDASYGGKPSFLRKQRCTIRESQGRGRKSLKRGLKFHNFLPSESITSEKEDKVVTGEGETWKVHAECRLREEHGTKQIMVSNWSVSGGNLSETVVTDDNIVDKEDSSLSSVNDVTYVEQFTKNISDINTLSSHITEKSIYVESRDNEKGTELKAIVDRLVMVPHTKINIKSSSEVPINNNSQSVSRRVSLRNKRNTKSIPTEDSITDKNNRREEQLLTHHQHSRRQRRKPLQTKKIVPYNEYLTMLEENESKPLDLSYQSSFPSLSIFEETLHSSVLEGYSTLPDAKNSESSIQSTFDPIDPHIGNSTQMPMLHNRKHSSETNFSTLNPAETATDSKKSLVLLNPCVNVCESSSPSSLTYVCPVSLFLGQQPSPSKDIQDDDKLISSLNKMPQISERQNTVSNLAIASQATLNTNAITSSRTKIGNEAQRLHVSKPRGRSNQRTIIRKKLEDTFRQNGFLVKTKQVTDGEATFCKFRQLRKYTRHYLKSWHHHLPEEVHKLWKGFLPSKTALPPSTGGKIALTKELSSLNSI